MDKKTLPVLNLPPFAARLRRDDDSRRGGDEIYDPLRRRWVALTPEEWVRQNFVNFLIAERQFPAALMANEVPLELNDTGRRADTLVYFRSLRPAVLVEYKAPEVAVTQKVFDQAARYNSVLRAPYIIVSNGLRHYCCRLTREGYRFLPDIPSWPTIAQAAEEER